MGLFSRSKTLSTRIMLFLCLTYLPEYLPVRYPPSDIYFFSLRSGYKNLWIVSSRALISGVWSLYHKLDLGPLMAYLLTVVSNIFTRSSVYCALSIHGLCCRNSEIYSALNLRHSLYQMAVQTGANGPVTQAQLSWYFSACNIPDIMDPRTCNHLQVWTQETRVRSHARLAKVEAN